MEAKAPIVAVVEKFYVYLDVACEYVGGKLAPGDGMKRLEWLAKTDLDKYGIVPVSRVLFRKLGYRVADSTGYRLKLLALTCEKM